MIKLDKLEKDHGKLENEHEKKIDQLEEKIDQMQNEMKELKAFEAKAQEAWENRKKKSENANSSYQRQQNLEKSKEWCTIM